MTHPIAAITVFCASSETLDPVYYEAAREVGLALAEHGVDLVYGAGSVGMMGVVARTAQAGGARVIGVITSRLIDAEQFYDGCDDAVVVETMRQRKQLMEQKGDAVIVLPGGVGTLEEFFEIFVGRLLGEHDKPIVLVNTAGYYDPLLEMLDHMIDGRFTKPGVRKLFLVVDQPREAVEAILRGDGRTPPDDSMLPSAPAEIES